MSDSGLGSCAKDFARNPDSKESAACFFELGRRPESRTTVIRGMQDRLRVRPDTPWLWIYLGSLKFQEDPSLAAQLYSTAAQLFRQRHDAAGELRALDNLHNTLHDLGRLPEAERVVERAIEIGQASDDPYLIAHATLLQARHLAFRAENERSYLLYRAAAATVLPRGPYPLQWECLTGFGNVCIEIGHFAEAKDYFRRLAALVASAGDRQEEASARYNLSRAALEEMRELPTRGSREEVMVLAREALDSAVAAGAINVEAKAAWMLGMLSHGATARRYLEQCIAVATGVTEKSSCRNALARQLASEEPVRAVAMIEEGLTLARQGNDPLSIARSLEARMRVSWAAASPTKALADSRSALDAIETLRGKQQGSTITAELFSTWSDDYYWLSGRLLESAMAGPTREGLEHAFDVTEHMRARTLLDVLSAAHAAPSPNLPAFAPLAEVQSALAGDEALLSFQIAPWRDWAEDFGGGSWLIAVTRDGRRVYRLADRVDLRQEIAAFINLFKRRNGAETAAAVQLYGELLSPALAELPPDVRKLIIVPDDALDLLPFAALRAAPQAPPLAIRYQLSFVPSATLWLRWRRDPPRLGEVPALALADPPFPVPPEEPLRPVLTAERGGVAGTLARLPPLPLAREEAMDVVDQLGGGSSLRLGEAASEPFLKGALLERFGLIHFATHAIVDRRNPENSAVVLASGTGKDDGFLEVHEIVDLKLKGRIVVLSSCDTAAGTLLRGEGVLSLARAFFQAGAYTVVGTLWPLRDDDGQALFERFYRHLSEGASVAAALRAAQSDRIAAGAPATAWAGLVVLGDGDLVLLPGGRSWLDRYRWRLAGAGLAALAGLVLLAAARRRRT